MTDVVTGTCASCGADIYDTRFCENCGAPVEVPAAAAAETSAPETSAVETTPDEAPATIATPVAFAQPAPQPGQAATPLRVITLILLLCAFLVPAIAITVGETQDVGQAPLILTVLFYCGVGLLALLSAVSGRASSGAKLGGALCALGFVAVFLIEQFTTIIDSALGAYQIADATVYLLLFLSWAISRPFRGGGYFGILFLVVLEVLSIYIAQGLYASAGTAATILSALINSVFVLVIVGLSALIERRRAVGQLADPSVGAPNLAASGPGVAVGGPINGKARASLTLALVGLGFNILSRVIPIDIGLAISVCAYALFIVAIILGHIARREVRTTGERGAGVALAGLLIGYIIIGLVLLLLLVGALEIASLASVL